MGLPHSTVLLGKAISRPSRSSWSGGQTSSPSPRYTDTCIPILIIISECITLVDIVICMRSVAVISLLTTPCGQCISSVMTARYLIALFVSLYFRQGGFTPLITSAAQGHFEVVSQLCQRGANIEARDYVSSRLLVYFLYACMDACMALSARINE